MHGFGSVLGGPVQPEVEGGPSGRFVDKTQLKQLGGPSSCKDTCDKHGATHDPQIVPVAWLQANRVEN